MPDLIEQHPELFAWLGLASLLMFLGTLFCLPVVVAVVPADYFVRPRDERPPRSVWAWAVLVVKNLLGVVFVVMGLAMLLLPGQGVLSILVGLMLLNFPGKRALEFWLVRQQRVRRGINWIRARVGKPPLLFGGKASCKPVDSASQRPENR